MTPIDSKKLLTPAVTLLLLVSACAPPDAARTDRMGRAYLRLLAAEDARPTGGRELATLTEAATSGPVFLRRAAVRALGRLENPELVPEIEGALDDPSPAVRAEAANALAQAVHRGGGDEVVELLMARAEVEPDSLVLAALARSIGRTASSPQSRARAAGSLIAISHAFGEREPLPTITGVALGFESLTRRARGQGLGGEAAARLVELTRYQIAGNQRHEAAPVRRLAYAALGHARRLDAGRLARIINDPDSTVRHVAAQFVDGAPPSSRPELIRRVLGGASLHAPIQAVLATAQQPRTNLYCRFLLAAAAPSALTPIRVPAIDALADRCPQFIEQRVALDRMVDELDGADPAQWHVPAHALVSLAQLSPETAIDQLPRLVEHPNPFARAYAARAAGLLDEREHLRSLARDPAPNVRTAALQALFTLDGHEIHDLLVGQLAHDDPQLLMTVARLMEGSPFAADAAPALLAAFERISLAERETWRDARRALLERLAELGDATLAPRLEPYLDDYDALVATDVAMMLSDWDGRARTASPAPLERMPLPTPEEYRRLQGARVVLHMKGGRVVIELFPDEATTNVFRFVRLAEQGYFDGLTFHRWAPNFVLQGGSPGANEYQGDGPYTRDEVGLRPHWRGTVGISTRGRDTGDGQLFVNLLDNVRLNHDYTIVGRVVEGMEVIDYALEGAIIERAEVIGYH